MTHVDSKPIIVIKFGVMVHEQHSDQFTEDWDVRAEKLRDGGGEPVGTEQLVNAEQVTGSIKFVVEVRSKLEKIIIGVRDLRHRAKCHEQRHTR